MTVLLEELANRARALAVAAKPEDWALLLEDISKIQSGPVDVASEVAANRAWFLASVCRAHVNFAKAFLKIKTHDFYEAWCDLERVEIEISGLFKNPFYDLNDFALSALRALVSDWQSLFPYAVFLSPEMIIKREVCSVCGEDVHPWSKCAHRAGRVYAGRMCHRIVKDFEAVSISLVRTPVQKYSVPFTVDEEGSTIDHYDYSIVSFLVDRLQGPFDGWSYEWTEAYHSHDMFADRDHDQGCPCGSGISYRDCCLGRTGVIRPHIQFSFDKPPPPELPNAYLGGYKDRNRPAHLTSRVQALHVPEQGETGCCVTDQ